MSPFLLTISSTPSLFETPRPRPFPKKMSGNTLPRPLSLFISLALSAHIHLYVQMHMHPSDQRHFCLRRSQNHFSKTTNATTSRKGRENKPLHPPYIYIYMYVYIYIFMRIHIYIHIYVYHFDLPPFLLTTSSDSRPLTHRRCHYPSTRLMKIQSFTLHTYIYIYTCTYLFTYTHTHIHIYI